MKLSKLTIIILLPALTAGAQNLSTEITVDRTIVPEQIASAPLPSVGQSVLAAPAMGDGLTLSEPSGTYAFQARVDSIAPGLFTGLPSAPDFKGYATAGYFPAYRLAARAGYRLADTPTTLLLASARFDGYTYHDPDRESANALTDNDFSINARWLNRFGRNVLDVEADFGLIGVRYPGVEGQQMKQSYTSGRARMSFGRTGERHGYHLRLGVDHLGANDRLHLTVPCYPAPIDIEPLTQTFLTAALGGYISNRSGASTFSLDADLTYLRQKGHDITVDAPLLIQGGPAYTFRNKWLTARVGVMVDLALGTDQVQDDDLVAINPDIQLRWMPMQQLAIHGSMTRSYGLNSLRHQLAYSHFITPLAPNDPRYEKRYQFIGGVDYGRPDGLRAHIEGEAARWAGIAMPYGGGGYSYFEPRLCDVLRAEFGAGYTVRTLWNLSLDAALTLYHTGIGYGSPENPDCPSAIFDIRLGARPLERLGVGIRYHLRTGRFASDGWDDDRKDLGTVSNLDISGTYRYSDRLTLALSLENMLNHRYRVLPTIVSAGITGMLSATYTF